jgi:hypothetical protein
MMRGGANGGVGVLDGRREFAGGEGAETGVEFGGGEAAVAEEAAEKIGGERSPLSELHSRQQETRLR